MVDDIATAPSMRAVRWPTVTVVGLVAVAGIEPDALWWTWGDVQVRSGQVLVMVAIGLAIVDSAITPRSAVGRWTVVAVVVHGAAVLTSGMIADRFPANVNASTFRLVLVAALAVAMWSLVRGAQARELLVASFVIVGAAAAAVGLIAVWRGGESKLSHTKKPNLGR